MRKGVKTRDIYEEKKVTKVCFLMSFMRERKKRKKKGQVGGGSAGSLITGRKETKPIVGGSKQQRPCFSSSSQTPTNYVVSLRTSRRGAASAYC